ncbi:MAG: TldD/PmbA family protein [Coriobacteriia bacterium]|nr:TldD/PmbA family protein [Coriobacteriia bacterium]
MTPLEARMLAQRAVEIATAAGAGSAEALVVASSSALTRFANNRIHQNVAWTDAGVSIRAVIGGKVGVASTNRSGDEALTQCCAAAVEAARHAPEDPEFPGLPAPRDVTYADRVSPGTVSYDAAARAEAAGAIVEQSAVRGLTAAGGVSVSEQSVAVANSLGVDVAMASTSARSTVLSMGPDEGNGWASFSGRDATELAASSLGDQAATLAQRSACPRDLAPGDYAVVLAPDAVADIVQFLGWYGGSAKSVEEGRSFLTGHAGERIMSDAITIIDDALAPWALGLTFDFEGMPKTRVALVEGGVAGHPCTDSYWAARTGRANTGHALPAPNSFGPIPIDLAMEPGESTPDELIASVQRGVYVTRFHYVNIEDPLRATLTGMTRDGTFLIEDGRLTFPLRNLRFTQSAIDALSHVGGVSAERKMVGEEGGALAPYLLLEKFAFTGQTR